MRIKLILLLNIVIIILNFNYCKAQDNFKFYDSLSVSLYNRNKWDSTIIVGKNALKNGNDYFYIRMRMGAARYEQKKYFFALNQFQNAYKFNSSDTSLLKYLYYSNVFINQKPEAEICYKKMRPSLQKSFKKSKFYWFTNVESSVGTSFNNNNKLLTKVDINGAENILGIYDAYDKSLFYQLSTENRIGKRLLFQYNFNQFLFNNFVYSKFNDLIVVDSVKRPLPFGYGNGFFYERIYKLQEIEHRSNYTINQKEIYFRSQVLLSHKIKLMASLNLIEINFTRETPVIELVLYKRQTIDNFYLQKLQVNFINEPNNFSSSVFSVGLEKSWNAIIMKIEATKSNLNNFDQKQLAFNIITYPFGNFNFFTKSDLTFEQQKTMGRKLIFNQLIGGKIRKNIFGSIFVKAGNISNYSEDMGKYIYNSTDGISKLFGGEMNFLINQHLVFNFTLVTSKFNSVYNNYTNISSFKENEIIYNQTTLKGGLKWTF